MNNKYRGAVFSGLVLILLVGMTSFLVFGGTKADAADCHQVGSVVTHRVEIRDGKMSPAHTDGRRCEKLLIENNDTVAREIAFGKHELHIPYDGISERALDKGQSFEVTLDKTGSYIFHDHDDEAVKGSFTVRP